MSWGRLFRRVCEGGQRSVRAVVRDCHQHLRPEHDVLQSQLGLRGDGDRHAVRLRAGTAQGGMTMVCGGFSRLGGGGFGSATRALAFSPGTAAGLGAAAIRAATGFGTKCSRRPRRTRPPSSRVTRGEGPAKIAQNKCHKQQQHRSTSQKLQRSAASIKVIPGAVAHGGNSEAKIDSPPNRRQARGPVFPIVTIGRAQTSSNLRAGLSSILTKL